MGFQSLAQTHWSELFSVLWPVTRVNAKNADGNQVEIKLTWALNSSASLAGSFLVSEQTLPRLISLTDTFLTLKPTLSPGSAFSRAWWCISTDLTSVVTLTGAKLTTIPGFNKPVSTRPTGTVPIPATGKWISKDAQLRLGRSLK